MPDNFEELLQFKEEIAELATLPVPLYDDTPLGQKTLELMLSPKGKSARFYLNKLRPTCILFPRGIFILSDGSVTTCCSDALGRNFLGSIYHTSLKNIWKTSVYNMVHYDLYEMGACKRCIGSGAASLTSSPDDILRWQKRTAGFPDYIQIEIMAACNYGCCISPRLHEYRPVKPDLDTIYRNIAEFIPHVKELNLFNHGEPLLHDGLEGFVEKCRKTSDRVEMTIATNGMLLDEQFARSFIENKVNRLIVSVHGGPGTEGMLKYAKVGADYERVISNLRRLVEMKESMGSQLPRISLKAILFNWNDNDGDMEILRSDAMSLGLRADLSADADNYYWVLNSADPDISSARFKAGSAELQQLKAASEWC